MASNSTSTNEVPQPEAHSGSAPVADALERMAQSFAESLGRVREAFHLETQRAQAGCERRLQEALRQLTLEGERRLQEALRREALRAERRLQEAACHETMSCERRIDDVVRRTERRLQMSVRSAEEEQEVSLPPNRVEELEGRVRRLETSVQSALYKFFPRVDRLLQQVEERWPSPTSPEVSASRERALHQAARAGQLDVVRALLDDGVDVNCVDALRFTPLHLAARGGHPHVLRFLATRGADLEAQSVFGHTAMHFAAQMDATGRCVRELIALGADVNRSNHDGATPLHLATRFGNVEAMVALTAAGGRV